jgi:hypothetical protein
VRPRVKRRTRAQLLTTALSADAQRLAAASVARSWAERDPAAAANWAMTLSEPQASARACEVIAAAWAKRDFVKTTAWLDGLPTGEARDAAITSFTQVASGIDAQGALAWAGAVADPVQRDTVTEKLLQSWITRDAMAARQWLQSSETVSPAYERGCSRFAHDSRKPRTSSPERSRKLQSPDGSGELLPASDGRVRPNAHFGEPRKRRGGYFTRVTSACTRSLKPPAPCTENWHG